MKPMDQITRKEKRMVSFCKNCPTSFCSVSVVHRRGLNQDTFLMLSSENSFPTNEVPIGWCSWLITVLENILESDLEFWTSGNSPPHPQTDRGLPGKDFPWLLQIPTPRSSIHMSLPCLPETLTCAVCPAPLASDTKVVQLNVTLFVFLLFGAEDKLPVFLLALNAGRLWLAGAQDEREMCLR